MRGIERAFWVSRRTLSAWLKEQANGLSPLEETLQPVECKKIPVLDVDELRSFVFRSKDKVVVVIFEVVSSQQSAIISVLYRCMKSFKQISCILTHFEKVLFQRSI